MQEQNFNQTQAGGYNPVLFQHLTQEEIQLYTIQVLMTLKRYRFTGKIVDTPPLLFFNTRDTFTTNISCKNESPVKIRNRFWICLHFSVKLQHLQHKYRASIKSIHAGFQLQT